MIQKLVEFCVNERLIVFIVALTVVAFGWHSFREVPIDAIPNVGENQVIVLTEWPGRSPKDIEDQITYPLSRALQSVAGAESVRGKSMFGFSFVQVTFDDSVDFYWARSRVSEQLLTVGSQLPNGASPVLAPDATALGQIYYYVLDPPPELSLADLRSKQDYVVKYALQSVQGVAEVASIGGYVRQYQVDVDPDKLRVHKLTLQQVIQSVRNSNIDVGAKTIESSGMEFLVRGKGFIGAGKTKAETIQQIEQTVITTRDSIPITIADIAIVQIGPSFRRGALDWNGSEAVGGVVVMRHGENPRQVIERVKAKIESLEKELSGIKIRGIYDRTVLVEETVATLTTALAQAIAITMAVILLFLLHVRASLVVATTLPVAVLIAFIAMNVFGVDANIMSLAGIAIAIGTMVDMGIIISENVFRGIADWEKQGRPDGEAGRLRTISRMAGEVAPAVVTAVSTTIVSFLPVFFLTGRDHRLFAPLAWTKTFSLFASLLVAVLLVPALSRLLLKHPKGNGWSATFAAIAIGGILAVLGTFVWAEPFQMMFAGTGLGSSSPKIEPTWFQGILSNPSIPVVIISVVGGLLAYKILRERLRPAESNVVAQIVNFFYEPTLRLFLHFKILFLAVPTCIVFVGLGAWFGLPTILKPFEDAAKWVGADFNKVQTYVDLKHSMTGLASDDWIALDEGSWFYMPSLYPAASLSQAMEILQTQDAMISKIHEVENVLGKIGRVDSALDPAPAGMIETYIMLKPRNQWRSGMTEMKIWEEINDVAHLPGITVADDLQPIEGRVVMLQSGIKASMAVRIYGDDLEGLSKAATAVAEKLKTHPLVNSGSVSPDIVMGKPYVEFEVKRTESARHGMTVLGVNRVIEAALGGTNATTTVEGRERYPVQVRYQRDLRQNINELDKIPVVTNTGDVVPLGRLAEMETTWGPSMINSEDARLVAHVAFSPAKGTDPLFVVDRVMSALAVARKSNSESEALVFPKGNFELEPVGSFQNQIEANRRLAFIIPIALLINIFIIYMQFRRLSITLIVFFGIPVAFGGGMIALAIAGTQLNTAVWVGFIALFGIAIDDGVVIATYLEQILKDHRLETTKDIRNSVVEAGLRRIRPCLMTTFTTIIGLVPVLVATGRGADVARAMAIPVFGGMVVELITLFVVPVVYCGFLEFKMRAGIRDQRFSAPEPTLSPLFHEGTI